MKLLFEAGIALSSLIPVTFTPVHNLKQPNMETNQNKETVRRLYEECLNKKNYDLLETILDKDYVGPSGEKGIAGFEETLKPLIQAFPNIHWTIEDVVAEDDKVVIRWSWQGTNTGAFRNIPASGKIVTNNAINIYELKNGKIVKAWMQSDRLGFLLQLGVISSDVVPGPSLHKQK